MKISRKIKYITMLLSVCIINACTSEENSIATQQGYLSVSANINGSYTMTDGSVTALPTEQVPEVADFSLTLATGEEYSHTWSTISEYPDNESYMIGSYDVILNASSRNDGPDFEGHETVNIAVGERTIALIECTPSDAMLSIDMQQGSSAYSLDAVAVHSDAGEYDKTDVSGNMFVSPGALQLYARLSDSQGRSVRIVTPYSTDLAAAHGEAVNVSLNSNELKLTSAHKSESYTIDKDIFEVGSPEIEAIGFTEGEQIQAVEGITLSNSIKMSGTSKREIAKARLTVDSPILNIVGAASEVDLMNLSDDERAYFNRSGMKCNLSADKKNLTIDYTTMLENLASYTSALSHFTLMLEDIAGVCSEPVTLDVNTQVLALTLESISTATIGVNKAQMTINVQGQEIEQPDFGIYATDADGKYSWCNITAWQKVDDKRVLIEFEVPEGDSSINIDVYYLGLQRFNTTVRRAAPEFVIDVDGFATNALVKIENDDDNISAALAKYASVSIEGLSSISTERYEDFHAILVSNLQDSKKYKITVDVAGTKKSLTFTTETALQVPEGDFEDWDPLFSYKHLPQGGKYSSTQLSIVNRQNYVDIDVKWPKKYWASVNAKTFNKQSSNHNTWYMQPSSVIIYEPQSGYKAICITSVGWDHSGEEIADYVQQSGESLLYSKVVPTVKHRSAGRLFLGSYSYNFATGAETFTEGYTFNARPSSLNGFFKYTADINHPNDRGYVEIEILNVTNGVETVIASGRAEFSATTDYKAFNVPLTYDYYNLKASTLKIMFASTTETGTQEYEDVHVPLTAHCADGAMTGSSLWIDNLSFTY